MVTSCFPLLPLILGGLAVYFARRARAGGDNSGAATAGLVVGIIATVFGVLGFLYYVVVIGIAITENT